MTGNLFSLTRDLAESRAELAEIEHHSAFEIGRLNAAIVAAEQRITDARLAGERSIAELREQIDEVGARLDVARTKLAQTQERFDAARGG
jgi:predicted  nucleic acid-binding Zn-ribbon protein